MIKALVPVLAVVGTLSVSQATQTDPPRHLQDDRTEPTNAAPVEPPTARRDDGQRRAEDRHLFDQRTLQSLARLILRHMEHQRF